MEEEKEEKPIIEIIKENEKWLEFPPRLSVKFGQQQPRIFQKSSRSFRVTIPSIKYHDVINSSQHSKRYSQDVGSLRGNNISGKGLINFDHRSVRDISFFGGTVHQKIDVGIYHYDQTITYEEQKEFANWEIKDLTHHDGSFLFGYPDLEEIEETISLMITIKDKKKFEELFEKVASERVTSLEIVIDDADDIPGLYEEEHGSNFFLLDSENEISNLSETELNSMSFRWMLSTLSFYDLLDSVADFYIKLNPDLPKNNIYTGLNDDDNDETADEIKGVRGDLEILRDQIKEIAKFLFISLIVLIGILVISLFK